MRGNAWFVTGASSGLGAAIARKALLAGQKVAVTARDASRLSSLVDAFGDAVLPLSMDLTDAEQVRRAVDEAIAHFGGIDVLINNAATGYLAAIEEGEDDKIRALFETNFLGVAATIRAVLPGMRSRSRGAIVNVSSNSGIVAYPGLGYYAASKFALEGLTEALAQEVAPLGIRVMAIEPGGIRTGIVERNLRSPAIEAYAGTAHGLIAMLENDDGTLAPNDPEKVAEVVVRLATSEEMPRRLILGADSWQGIHAKLELQTQDYDRWKDLSHSTYFDAASTGSV